MALNVGPSGDRVREVERFAMGSRMRAIKQVPAGNIWMLEDHGQLLKLTPRD